MRRAALFDMDRTLVRKDTATLYVRYQRQVGEADRRVQARVAWWLLQYSFGVIDAEGVAARALADFRGRRERWMEVGCRDWYRRYVREHVCEGGREAVARHKAAGDVTAIVTGATRYAAEPLAEELGIDHVVCTRLDVSPAGRFTGRFVPPMCYGPGKIVLTEALAAEVGFSVADSTFYTDSITDLPLLEAVREPVVVNPDRRLSRVATKRGWPILRW